MTANSAKLNIINISECQLHDEIRQYLSLSNLVKYLLTQKYYLRKKKCFEDLRESEYPIKNLFYPVVTNNKVVSQCDYRGKIESQLNKGNEYRELTQSFVSCWTMSTFEDVLMWKSYAPDYGVCIKSTINNFIASFNSDDFKCFNVYCAPVKYRRISFADSSWICSFIKSEEYRHESEVRFVFQPKYLPTEDALLISSEYKVLIDEIVLSPYIDSQLVSFIQKNLVEKFDIKVSQSKINIKSNI